MSRPILPITVTNLGTLCRAELTHLLLHPALAGESLLEALFDRLEGRQ